VDARHGMSLMSQAFIHTWMKAIILPYCTHQSIEPQLCIDP
jgi:hypothetical protein